jgi:hypothetical protein
VWRLGDVVGVGRSELALDSLAVVGHQLGGDRAGFQDVDPHVLLGDLLAQRLGEAVHHELGHVVDAEVPALLIRMLRRPNRSTTVCTTASA